MDIPNTKATKSSNEKHFPNILQSIYLSLFLILLSFFISIVYEFIFNNNTIIPGLMLWMNVPIFAITFGLGLYWSKKPISYFIYREPTTMQIWLLLLLTTFGLLIVLGELTNCVLYIYPIPDHIYALFESVLSSGWGVMGAILVAAITEEFLFRGLILSGLSKIYSFWPAIIISSILFGAIHLIPWQIFPAIIAGIFLGWIYLKFKSIWLCIGVHAFNNSIAAIPEFLNITIEGLVYDVREGVQFQPYWLDIIGLFCLVVGVIKLNKISSLRLNKDLLKY